MICPNCKAENPEGASFCASCGNPLPAEEAVRAENPDPQPPTPQPDPEPPTPQPTPEPQPPAPPIPQPPPQPPAPPGTGATAASEPASGEEEVSEPVSEPVSQQPVTTPQPAAAGAPEPTTPMMPGVPPPGSPGVAGLGGGWGKALVRGLVAFVIVVLVGQVLAFLAVADDPSGARLGDVAKGGGVLFYLFHHVGLAVDLPTLAIPQTADSPFGGPADVSFTFALALMGGTALFLWLMYRGGRAVALSAGGTWGVRAVHGAKVALFYAILTLGASFLISYSVDLPPLPFFEGGQPVDISVTPVGAFLWPLLLGLVMGALGGARSAREDLATEPRSRFLLGAVSGGWRMTWVGVLLAFAGYLLAAFLNPDVPLPFGPEYFRVLLQESTLMDGILLFLFTLLIAPNIGVLVLIPAMGGALGFFGSVTGVSVSCSILSLTKFPVGSAPEAANAVDPCASLPIEFATAPVGYFAFLLVPLVAAILGGRRAARRAEAETAAQGGGVGAVAGVVFGVFVAGLILLASIVLGFSGEGGGTAGAGSFSAGPGLAIGAVLAIAWGAAGGALGGAMVGRRAVGPTTTEAAPAESGAPPAPRGTTGFEV